MRIKHGTLRRLQMPLREPFVTSYGREDARDLILVEIETTDGAIGIAECVAGHLPLYTEETTDGAWFVLRDVLLPMLRGVTVATRADLSCVSDRFRSVRGHAMAKAAIEMALWDAFSAEQGIPLRKLLGGTKRHVPVGISIGMQSSREQWIARVSDYLEQGFQRVKVKIAHGHDIAVLRALRNAFPTLSLVADANSAYTLNDVEILRQFDALELAMIEQPLGWDDLIDHAALAKEIRTPICLDESIRSDDDARKAIAIGACRVINLKPGRVGGFAEALRIHDRCVASGVTLWCGGMLETGIGRLHNLALSSLPGFSYPGDMAPSARYFREDLIDPPVAFAHTGHMAVEDLCGVYSRVVASRVLRVQSDVNVVPF